jgi:hypothetical protein
MKTLVSFLPVLGCAGAMVLCMRMMRGEHRQSSDDQTDARGDDVAAEVAALRAEVAQLRAERGELTASGSDAEAS